MHSARLLKSCALAFLLATVATVRAGDTVYLFTYFTGNGEDGLHLAWSEDGYRWTALNNGRSFLAPQIGKDRLMRDPCVTRGPDGTYHLVWTSGWWDNHIGHASTKDFLTWSEQQSIPVMAHEPTVRNSWAPEVAWDPKRGQFVVFWASTIPGRFPETEAASEDKLNHRIYATMTKDWQTFAPTRLFCDPGFSVIDATLLPAAAGRWQMIVKDETVKPPKKHLRIATADDIEGPWREFAPPFTRDWVEGPTAITVGDDTLVYFDVYREKHYGAMRSRDRKSWEDVTAKISLPRGARHGTMIAVPRALVERLRAERPDVERLVRFDAPANHFTASAPLGNGRLGLMPFGGIDEERIVLNEAGMWSGSPQDADRPDAAAALPEIRRLLLEGKNAEAEKLVAAHFTCAGAGSGRGNGAVELQLLPALPPAWRDGEVRGLRARGGFEVDLRRRGGALERAVGRSLRGTRATVHYGERSLELNTLAAGGAVEMDGALKEREPCAGAGGLGCARIHPRPARRAGPTGAGVPVFFGHT